MIEIGTILSFIQAAGIIVGVAYYIMNIRISQRNMKENLQTRQTQLFMQIFQRFQDPEFTNQWNILMERSWKDADDFMKKYQGNPASDGASLLSVQTNFEGVAVILMKNMIDIDIVYELMPTMATVFWKKYEPLIKQLREEMGYPQLFRPVEYLSDRLVEHAMVRGDPVLSAYQRSDVKSVNTQ